MHGNKGLMEDLQAVFQDSKMHVRKTSQKIKTRKVSSIRGNNHDHDIKNINYRISHLQNFSSDCFSGVILIIEDSTALEYLHNEFKEVQKEIRILASPIGTETKLQKCIRELTVMISHIDNPEMKDSLNEVITRLKGGGLKKPKLKINSNDYDIGTITSILDMSPDDISKRMPSLIDSPEYIPMVSIRISLEELRNWDLNAFCIENEFEFIYAMLNDFDLIQRYHINHLVLYKFISRIKEKCNQ